MFDSRLSEIELSEEELRSGESDELAYLITIDEMATGWETNTRHQIPDLTAIPAGPFLGVILESIDRTRLNGHDLVNVLKARERQLAHLQAQAMADTVEISYATPGHTNTDIDTDTDIQRLAEQFEYASDEIRAALTLTRRAAEYRLSAATDIIERVPQVWELLNTGVIDMAKARAFADGTCHVPDTTARFVVAQLAGIAPSVTVSQLKHRIRKLCATTDPESAKKREETAHQDRRVVLEPTIDGTGDLHLYGLKIGDLRAIGRRINGHLLSLKKEDRTGRTHDQLRADIVRDLLLGADPTNGGKGLVDIRVPVATLDGGNQPGEISGHGPVTAETARHIINTQPNADHVITLIDSDGNPTHIYTLSRRATKTIRRHMNTLQPTCSFPGCIIPATECDLDHLKPWNQGGETSTTNSGPKCDHDHTLKDQGWTHQRQNNQDIWTSPLGHTYISRNRSP